MKNYKTITIANAELENFKNLVDETIENTILNSYNFKHSLLDKVRVFNTISCLSLVQEDLVYLIDIRKTTNNYEYTCRSKFEYKLIKSLIAEN